MKSEVSQPEASPAEQVRVCPTCSQLNSAVGITRCSNCWIPLAGVHPVGPEEVERLFRRRRLRGLRGKLLLRGVSLAAVLGLIIWGAAGFLQLGGGVPAASTNLSVDLSPDAWAQGRRTVQNTAFTSNPAPVPRSVKWAFATNRPLVSSPAIAGERVYLTTGDGRTVALDRESGQLVWEFRTGLVSSSTPVVAGDLVIAAYTPGLIVALDRNSGLAWWEVDLSQPISSSPILVNGALYFGAGDSRLHAMDASTGADLWSFRTTDWIVSPVAYTDGTVAVVPQDSHVFLVDAESGQQRLMYNTGFQRFGGGPTIAGDTVYVSSDRGWVSAIDRLTKTYPGQGKWFRVKINLWVWQVISERPVQPGTLWSRRLGGQIKGLLAVAHGTVYGATEQGQVFALNADNGAKRWSTKLKVEISTAPSVAGNTVLVGTEDGRVFGLDAANGDVLWDYRAGIGEIVESPVVAGNTMYVASADGTLYAITGDGN